MSRDDLFLLMRLPEISDLMCHTHDQDDSGEETERGIVLADPQNRERGIKSCPGKADRAADYPNMTLARNTDARILARSAIIPAGTACLVRVTPTEPKYTAST